MTLLVHVGDMIHYYKRNRQLISRGIHGQLFRRFMNYGKGLLVSVQGVGVVYAPRLMQAFVLQ